MCDLADVVNTLASLTAGMIYPNGTASPSIVNAPVSVIPGWPLPQQLDGMIAAGSAIVSIFPMPGMDANTTEWMTDALPTAAAAPQLTMTVSGATVTIGGTINAGEAAALLVNAIGYAHAIVASDTFTTIAAALAALVTGATSSGAVFTAPATTYELKAGVSAVVPLQATIGRQRRIIKITCWCPTPTMRDSLGSQIDAYYKNNTTRRIVITADNTYAKIVYRGTLMADDLERTNIYRRDLMYELEYFTTFNSTSNTITNLQLNLTPNGGNSINISAIGG